MRRSAQPCHGRLALFWVMALWAFLAGCGLAQAQDSRLSALAQLDPARSGITGDATQTDLRLGLSQPVAWRAFLLDNPPRLVVDFREVDFSAQDPAVMLGKGGKSGAVQVLRWGPFRPGWSRLVAELSGPMKIAAAQLRTGEAPELDISLTPVSKDKFETTQGDPNSALWDLPQPAPVPAPILRQDGSRPLRVVLDPGHGGIDPGAEAEGTSEAVLVLTFARELKEALTRAGIDVVMTRNENVFVPLETRLTIARKSEADLFISLHADALASGKATGTAIYMLDEKATDDASQKLAERHDRADILAGVDLDGHGDDVARVLMDLARTETRPRTVRFTQVLVGALKSAGVTLYKHPVQGADFSVLKSADFPSVLIELGFLDSERDRKHLLDDSWRKTAAAAITQAVQSWAQSDAAEARLLRQ
ncbi:N-acetylmuramoyl-L-alanine amidase [Thioclava sp. GXIMD4216]|uniref:N-acetylmuramoyl-L-alanine amidase n=1 Tax=Thioclava sp. GXIMD4216 TaxID=3131929 RepID=UPI0030D1F0BD